MRALTWAVRIVMAAAALVGLTWIMAVVMFLWP